MTHFPPFYSLVLAAPGRLGADPLDAARWLDVSLIFLLVMLVGAASIAIFRSSDVGLATSIILVSSLVYAYSGAISEPLFLLLSLLSVLSLALYVTNHQTRFAFVGAVAAGLAILTRYPGLTLLLSGPLTLLFLSRRSWFQRLAEAGIFDLIAGLPLLVYMASVRIAYHAEWPRQVAFSLPAFWERLRAFLVSTVQAFWKTFPFWDVLPEPNNRVKLGMLLVVCVVVSTGIALLAQRARRRPWSSQAATAMAACVALLLFMLAHVFGLAFAAVAVSPPPDVDVRMLLPLWVPGWLILFSILHLGRNLPRELRVLGSLPVLMALLVVVHSLPADLSTIADLHEKGAGYTSRVWRASGTLSAIRDLPSGVLLISNESAAVLLQTGRAAYDIPELADGKRRPVAEAFGDDTNDPVETKFREHGAALVLFSSILVQLEGSYGAETGERLAGLTSGLALHTRTLDGGIYFYPP